MAAAAYMRKYHQRNGESGWPSAAGAQSEMALAASFAQMRALRLAALHAVRRAASHRARAWRTRGIWRKLGKLIKQQWRINNIGIKRTHRKRAQNARHARGTLTIFSRSLARRWRFYAASRIIVLGARSIARISVMAIMA